MENYLNVLEESLYKKLAILDSIQDYNERQFRVFCEESPKLEEFDATIEEKGRLIEEMNRLDSGFEILYANLAEQLKQNRDRYAPQIQKLQELITQVTDQSMTIQAQEARNKRLIEEYFTRERSRIREGRKNSKAALGYYKSMSQTHYVEPQFLDDKY